MSEYGRFGKWSTARIPARRARALRAALMTEPLEARRLLSSSISTSTLTRTQQPAIALQATSDANTLELNNQSQTYASLTDTIVTMTGKSELFLTAATTPLSVSQINLNSQDSWLYFRNVKPSVVNSTYLSQVRVNGAAAVSGSNVRVVQYETGTVVIPHSSSYQALQTFTGANFSGTSKSYNQYTYYNTAGTLGDQNRAISSFKLKRGYMATVAANANGSGVSKVYVASDHDIDVSVLPTTLNNAIQFVRVLPWRWVAKKGASDLSASTLNAAWSYNWNNDQESSLDHEYVPIRQQRYWPGYPTNKQNVNNLLGFNEPNNPVEDAYETLGEGSIETALATWPELMATGLRLGSPAVTDGGKAWLYEFMDKAIARNLRVDFIAIHNYQANHTAASLKSWLQDIYDRYHLPIWLTEFNNGANWTTAADPTYAQNASWVGSITDMLDTTPWIERYSIYSRVEAVRQMTYDAGGLTPAGQVYYDNASPIGYVQDPVPDSNTGARNIAQLPLNGNALDTSGNGNNGEVAGAAAYVSGQHGQALVFDGASTSVRLPENVINGNAFSFAAWVKWDGGANWQRIFDFGDGTNVFAYLTPSNGSQMRFNIKTASLDQAVTTSVLPANTWTHVAVTLGGGQARIYVNGVQTASAAVTALPSAITPLNNYLGKSQFAADPLFNGAMDDVHIVDYAMTGAQVAALMTNNAPQFTSTTLTRGPALRGVSFSGTIAGAATDSDPSDLLTYGKSAGPSWLNVAADGTLSGTPTANDTGAQEFTVTATDFAGMTTYATLIIEIGETYWRGDVSNVWSADNSGNTNWSSNSSGTTDVGSTPNASSDVVFAATGATNLPSTILGANMSVRSVRIVTATGVAIGGTHTLTLGTDGVRFESGAGNSSITTSGGVVLAGDQTWTLSSTNSFLVSAVLSGAATLTKDGTGTLTLLANNTFTGGVNVLAGTLQLGSGGAAGTVLGNILNNGSLFVNRSNDFSLDGVISGTGSLRKEGAGRLTLSATNTFSGGATIGANQGVGVVRATANNALGTGTVVIGPGGNSGATGRLELSGNITIPNAVTLPLRNNSSVSVQNISGNNRLSGTITIDVGGSNGIFQSDAGLLTLGAITTSATGSRIPTFTGSGNGLINGVISNGTGTVGIIKSGSGTWTLSAVNSYTGATTITQGTLAISGNERIANAAPITLSGGTFATGGFSETLGALTLSTNSGINFGSGNSTLTFGSVASFGGGVTLNVTNWTAGADHLFIGSSASLTAGQLAQIKFNGTSATQLSTGEVVPVISAAPTIATAASATLNGASTSATLSVLGADDGGEANLLYTWTVTSKPAGAADPTFSVNGTNGAKNSVATFTKAGSYTFLATILDGSGQTVTSSVSVTVSPTFSGIAAASSTVPSGTSVAVRGADQFGDALSLPGGATWSTNVGTITQAGVFTAPSTGNATNATMNAVVDGITYTTNVTLVAGRAWYKADQTGSSLIDSSGAGNHGTLTGSYSYAAGQSGSALSLSGGAANLPAGIVSGLTDFTFSAWVNLSSNPNWSRIFDFGSGETSNMFFTNNAAGSNILRFAITTSGSGGEQKVDAAAIPTGVWTHLAVTLVGDVATIYVNGVAVGTNTNFTLRPASLGNTTNNYLGDSQYASDPAFQGRLDDIRILGTGLNAAGVVALRDAWRLPTVVNGGASATPVDGGATTSDLSVLGGSAAGESGLTYTWSVLGAPPAPVTFSINGTNAAKNSIATFTASGTYDLLVTITNALGASVTSTVSVNVNLTQPTTSVESASENYGVATHTLTFTFAADVGSQTWSELVEIKSADGDTSITPSSLSYDASSRTLTVWLPSAASIADGNYTATVKKGSYLADDYVMSFFMLAGDANRDRTVNFTDLLAVAQNYGGLDKTYEQGDFNGDGIVNFSDLLRLAQSYSQTLPPQAASQAMTDSDELASRGRGSNAAADLIG